MKFCTNHQTDTFHLIKYVLVDNKGTILFYTLLFHVLLEYFQIPIDSDTGNCLRKKPRQFKN